MTFLELKEAIKAYVDQISGDEPSDRDIDILEMIEDYAEPEGISEEEIQARITEAVNASDAEWRKKFKDRFYGRENSLADEKEQPETVADPVIVENEPEEEEFKSILDFEW